MTTLSADIYIDALVSRAIVFRAVCCGFVYRLIVFVSICDCDYDYDQLTAFTAFRASLLSTTILSIRIISHPYTSHVQMQTSLLTGGS